MRERIANGVIKTQWKRVLAGLVLCVVPFATSADERTENRSKLVVRYGPNIVLHGNESQIRRMRYWLDQIYRVPKGKQTLAVITQTPHELHISHSKFAVIAAGRTAAPMTMDLSNGIGADVSIAFNAEIPDRGSHRVFTRGARTIPFTATQNLYHELAHAMHKMSGTWRYAASERQAIAEENEFRADLSDIYSLPKQPRLRTRGTPVCPPPGQEPDRRWGQDLICD